ncbi:hypothetical protein AKO1_004771 [Acrasis kona]|uniref:Uncharacterized protein n=1 Tax=Acrasis kona TaxID=1008807 RepID=A0AAW2Z442_9EUKA
MEIILKKNNSYYFQNRKHGKRRLDSGEYRKCWIFKDRSVRKLDGPAFLTFIILLDATIYTRNTLTDKSPLVVSLCVVK